MKSKKGNQHLHRLVFAVVSMALVIVLFCTTAFAAYSTLKIGSTGEKVRTMQKALIALGYYTGVANGTYGRDTEAAVRLFQTKNDLKVDGKAGDQTLTELYKQTDTSGNQSSGTSAGGNLFNKNYSIMRYGSHGDRVRTLQKALATLGYNPGKIDGVYGAATQRAVSAVQRKYGLKEDGKAGPETLAVVEKACSGGTIAVPPAKVPTVSSTRPRRTLKRYNEGNDVVNVQSRLKAYGFYDGKIDGVFGRGTVDAVKKFQTAYNLKSDGICGNEVYNILFADSKVPQPSPKPTTAVSSDSSMPKRTLRRGNAGDDVKSLQTKLKAAGFYNGKIDGKYGAGTMTAVKEFQKKNNLAADGVAGKATYAVLYKKAPAPTTQPTQKPTEKPADNPTSAPTATPTPASPTDI